ncbi:MAG: DinB family protein, partial [Acidobacteriota bacterium]
MPPEMKRLTINQAIIAEMDQEAVATRNLINVIPEDKLDWRPHAKGKSLGELAMHIAGLQGNVAQLADMDEAPRPNFPPDPIPAGCAEILSAFEDSLKKAKEIVDATSEERLYTDWKMVDGDKVLFAAPRA